MWLAPTGWTGGRWAAWLVAITLGSLLVMADTAARQETASAAERSPGWGRYRDRDFGMTFDFPARIFPLKSAEQGGEGFLFSTPDGRARLRVFGFRNEASHTPRGYLSRIANFKQSRFTYVRTTRRFFVASGTRDGMIFYRRCNFFRDKRVGCLQLDYPVQEKRAWDDIVTRISLSLAAADRNAAQIDSKSVPFDAENANSTLVANKQTRSSIPFGKKNDPVARRGKHTIAEKMAALPPAQLHHKADPITEKAKASIAAMMEDPASAEFGEIRRAVKILRGESLDIICGYVKGKNASGGDTQAMPFLYIVQQNEAYLVDGTSPLAETVYGVLCN